MWNRNFLNRINARFPEGELIEDIYFQIITYLQIDKIYMNADNVNKSMKITITDEELLKMAGGIVQGMSGSPIIQNEKLVGAVTHVLINNPEKGYGIFIEEMIAH